jgi:predicted DCC family thiol-disulfide oxidoreductase YuxK
VGQVASGMSWVLFFDGDCGFCFASVRSVHRLDKHGRVYFAPLQGELARKLGLDVHASETGGTMVLLREGDGKLFTRSDALLELARALGWPWRLARAAVVVPRRWRDGVYQFIADHRLTLSGKTATCQLPDTKLVERLRG